MKKKTHTYVHVTNWFYRQAGSMQDTADEEPEEHKFVALVQFESWTVCLWMLEKCRKNS